MLSRLFRTKLLSRTIEVKHVNKEVEQDALLNSSALGPKSNPGKAEPEIKGQRIFLLEFDGDTMATQADALAKEVTYILSVANPETDIALIKITSPGGAAHAYGYASSQIERFRKAGVYTIAAVDKVAASGGYMMAVVANKIIAAPYAIVGSIGVVAEFPNFFNVLKRFGIDYHQYTAGEFKRTVSTFGEITPEGEDEFRKGLLDMYKLFCDHVLKYREVDISQVATGKHWHATQAAELGLVDQLITSEEYIISNLQFADIFRVKYIGNKKGFGHKLSEFVSDTLLNTAIKFMNHLQMRAIL